MCPFAASVDLTTLLMAEPCQLMILFKSNRPVFSNSGECVKQQTKQQCDFSCSAFAKPESSQQATEQVSKFTTPQGMTMLCSVFEQPETHKRTGLLSQPQQLSQHISVSCDLCVREGPFQRSSSQINDQAFDSLLTWSASL